MKPTPIYITPKLYETAKVRRNLMVEGINPHTNYKIAECDAIIESWEGAQHKETGRGFAEALKACDRLDAVVSGGGKEGEITTNCLDKVSQWNLWNSGVESKPGVRGALMETVSVMYAAKVDIRANITRATKELAEALKAANDRLNLQAAAAELNRQTIADLKKLLAKARQMPGIS